jgi:hypothetical protein
VARIEDIERRLLNWARWKLGEGGGVLGYAGVCLTSDTSRLLYREAIIPTVDCEADETDRAVQALEPIYRRTIEVVYVEEPSVKRAALLLCVAESTMKGRVSEAHRRLSNWFADKAQQRRAARDRVEQMQASARPPAPPEG